MVFDSSDNLYVGILGGGGPGTTVNITPSGVQSVYNTGLINMSMAFNNSGVLFIADAGSQSIYEMASDGTPVTYATGFINIDAIAFDSKGNLFVADVSHTQNGGSIIEVTPGGAQITYAAGLSAPSALAFDSAGDLFESDSGSGKIYKYTPSGTKSTFASGLNHPYGLAFNSAGILFEADYASGKIYEYTASGTRSTFASLTASQPLYLAFEPAPEPSVIGLLAVGVTVIFGRHRKQY